MKRKISILLLTVTLLFCLCIPVFADSVNNGNTTNVSFNDDFTKLYYNGKTYQRIDASMIDYDYNVSYDDVGYEYSDGVYTEAYSSDTEEYTVIPNPKHTNVKDIYVYSNYEKNLFFADITYKDGAVLSSSYLMTDYLGEYERIVNGKSSELTVDFYWPEDNQIVVDANKITNGTSTEISYYSSTEFEVYAEASDKSFRAITGFIYENDEKFYYFDFNKAGITYDDYMYGDYEMEDYITVSIIDDEETILLLEQAVEKYYDDEMGFIYDDELGQSVSKIFFAIILLLIPLGICVGSLILFITSKKPTYKKIFATICVLSLLEIITVVAVIILYNHYT